MRAVRRGDDIKDVNRPGPVHPGTDPTVVVAGAFRRARTRTIKELASEGERRAVALGRVVIRQGDMSPLFLITAGHFGTRRTTADGRELLIRILGPGDLGGLTCLISRPSVADLVPLTDSEVMVWPCDTVLELAARDAGFAVDVMTASVAVAEEVATRLDGFVYQNARQRVARVLEQYRELWFADTPVLTRRHLPGLVGTSREMVGRVLRSLESDEVVARSAHDRLRLISGRRLTQIASAEGEATD